MKKCDQISPPVFYHAEKATEVFQSIIILHAHVHEEKKLFESFKAKEESSPPHAIHFEALTHTTHIRIIIIVVVVNTHRERSPEKRSKDRNLVATEIRKKEKKEN